VIIQNAGCSNFNKPICKQARSLATGAMIICTSPAMLLVQLQGVVIASGGDRFMDSFFRDSMLPAGEFTLELLVLSCCPFRWLCHIIAVVVFSPLYCADQ
jgi:hypothetical protein